MKVAIAFFGQTRRFFELHNYINNSIKNETGTIDIYIATWFDKKYTKNFKLLKNIKKIIELDIRILNKISLKLFGNLYPMILAQSKVLKLIENSRENYDMIFLSRMDTLYLNKINFSKLLKNKIYTGKGHTVIRENEKKLVNAHKDKLKLSNSQNFGYIKIFDKDCTEPFDNLDSKNTKTVCDHFYIGNLKNLIKYNNKIYNILNLCAKKFSKLSLTKKVIFFFTNFFLKYFYQRKIFFKIYKFINFYIGFYIPFWVPKSINRFSYWLPSLQTYSMLSQNIKFKELNVDYILIRDNDDLNQSLSYLQFSPSE